MLLECDSFFIVRKSKIKEIIDFTIYVNWIDGYTILNSDFDSYKKISLHDWLENSKVDSIPHHRISTFKKNNKIVFQRSIVR